jgi:hypothetical protein
LRTVTPIEPRCAAFHHCAGKILDRSDWRTGPGLTARIGSYFDRFDLAVLGNTMAGTNLN